MRRRVLVDSAQAAADKACALGDAVAIAVNFDTASLSVLTATPFGNTLRRWEGEPRRYIARVIRDTFRAQRRSFVYASDAPQCADEGVFDLYSGRKADLPRFLDERGVALASWWAVAPYHKTPFRPGDELQPFVIEGPAGCSVAYRHKDGRAAGVHISTKRQFNNSELELVRSSRAVVRSVSSGRSRDGHGSLVSTQVLSIEIPYDFAIAFSEGTLPLRPAAMTFKEVSNA